MGTSTRSWRGWDTRRGGGEAAVVASRQETLFLGLDSLPQSSEPSKAFRALEIATTAVLKQIFGADATLRADLVVGDLLIL